MQGSNIAEWLNAEILVSAVWFQIQVWLLTITLD